MEMKNCTRVSPRRVGQGGGPVRLITWPSFPGQPLAKGEEQRGDSEQVRNQVHKSSLRGMQEYHSAHHAADDTDSDQRDREARGPRQAFPVGEDARHRPRPDRHGVRGIGGDGRNSGKNEGRKSEETSAARDRVDGAGQYRSHEKENSVGESHVLSGDPVIG